MDELVINLRETLGYTPEVIGYLAGIKNSEYSYRHYCLRHPGGIFNLSTSYVLDAFLDLLAELENYQSDCTEGKKTGIAKKFRQLINDFFKFYESCFEVIQACCKIHPFPSEKEPLWQWLEKNGYEAGKIFFKKLDPDLSHYRKIYNNLKHTSNSIQPICFHKDSFSIAGYYLQSVAIDGSVGPNETIHPKYQNTYSASSYNFNLRKLYYLIYKVSYVLQESLMDHFKQTYNRTLSFNNDYKANDKRWSDLNQKISKLPSFYFPNEFNQLVPESTINTGVLMFKMKAISPLDLNRYRVELSESGNGFSRSFRLPFYRPEVKS